MYYKARYSYLPVEVIFSRLYVAGGREENAEQIFVHIYKNYYYYNYYVISDYLVSCIPNRLYTSSDASYNRGAATVQLYELRL